MPGIEVGGAGVSVNPQNISGSEAYKFRQQQGEEALNRSAGARGTLLTGGTIKDALAFNSGLASQEYGNEWQRQFGLAGLNADISSGNASRNLSGLTSLYSGGLSAAGGMAGLYGRSGEAGAAGSLGSADALNYGVGAAGSTLSDYFKKKQAGKVATAPYSPPAGSIPTSPTGF